MEERTHAHSHLALIPGGLHTSTEHARPSRPWVDPLPTERPVRLAPSDSTTGPLEADPDLQDIIARWPSLAPERREIIMQLAGFLPDRYARQPHRQAVHLFVRRVREPTP